MLGEIRADWRWRNHIDVPIEVRIDGATIASQQGGNPVGDPFRAVVALAEHLAARGMALLPGQFVMTGAYTGVHHLKPGQRIELRCEGLQPVELQVLDADQTSPIPKESLHAGREGAVAIWNGIAEEGRKDFYDWHLHEHMPERLGIPGFLRGRRYRAADKETKPEFFTLYETSTFEVIRDSIT